jgi:hypothetical protein
MVKKYLVSSAILLLISFNVHAQLSENFSDGDFKVNPSWVGDSSSFIINKDFQLQSNSFIQNTSYSLVTNTHECNSVQWETWMRLAFNPSSANYIDIYLTSSSKNPNDSANSGYFVRCGNTDDEISLYRRDSGGVITKIIDGKNGTLNHTDNIFKLKVTRDSSENWNLYSDFSGTGNSYLKEGAVKDATYKTSSWFGFVITQSTSGFFNKHFVDDIEIRSFVPDVLPPEIVSVNTVSSNQLDVLYNEPIESSSNIYSAYSANNGLGMPDSATLDTNNPSLAHLVFADSFDNGYTYTLTINGIKDAAGNTVSNASSPFIFYKAQRYDVIVDEIFADPSPSVGLPNYEWIELKNSSAFPINMKGWKLSDASTTSGSFPELHLLPDSFVIVCSTSALSTLAGFGKAISITHFPSLDNDGDLLSLSDESGNIIHAVQYSSDWYQNELKKAGGWSLEMINTKYACSAVNNWIASKDNSGGTPGRKNSVDGTNTDGTAFKLIRAHASYPTTITLIFNKPVDSLKASNSQNYIVSNSLVPAAATLVNPLFDKVSLSFNNPISKGIIYTVGTKNISDCAGNPIAPNNTVRFGLPENADSFDIVINEILFNPLPQGVDYVELYNRSDKIIDLSKIYVGNRNSSNVVSSLVQLTTEPILFFPKDFITLTTDPSIVKSQYITPDPDAFLKINPMPSFPDKEGDVTILNAQGNIIDEVAYSDKWHFPLIANTEGVSLERIDYNAASVQSNFHSAATSVGYGTPGYKNSQYKLGEIFRGTITVTPSIFSPDNDGIEDFATISYKFPTPGYVANISIFDASGRPVRFLEKNSLSGINGYYRWDGLNDKGQKLPQGIYIIYTEIFNKEGKKQQFKNTIVLARKNY